MARAKQTSKRKRREKALPVWGAAGMSLAMAGGASAAIAPTTNGSPQTAAPAPLLTLEEEEISDVSLATFYVFDRENMGAPRLDERIAQRCGRCGGGCRCGGAAGMPVRRRVRDSPMRRLPMRGRLPVRRGLAMRRRRLRMRHRLHLQLQLLHIVGLLHLALLDSSTVALIGDGSS